MGELSPLHLILVLVIALIVVGPGKLPEVGAAIGKSIREFRKATSDVREAVSLDAAAPMPAAPAVSAPVVSPPVAPAPFSAFPDTSAVAVAPIAEPPASEETDAAHGA